jgi:hypothetical protein
LPDLSRRFVITTAAGLAASNVLPAKSQPFDQDVCFRIEPTERFLEIRRLQKALAEMKDLDALYADTWNRLILLQREISATPRTPAELLE